MDTACKYLCTRLHIYLIAVADDRYNKYPLLHIHNHYYF